VHFVGLFLSSPELCGYEVSLKIMISNVAVKWN